MKRLIITALFVLISACSSPESRESKVDFSGLSEGWNEIIPGGDTACANGDAFTFSFLPGSPSELTVILPGGGACSSYETCDFEEGTFLPGMVGGNVLENRTDGIFDLDNPRNPIAEQSILFIPYCTGDVFLGDRIVTYENAEGVSVTIPHVGLTNTMFALNWMFERVHSPSKVAVLGMSAGAIATPFYAGILAEHYPSAQINQLGDGAGAYQGQGVSETLRHWQDGALFEDIDWIQPFLTDSTEFTTLYDATSQAFDQVRLHQYNSESDSVQVFFVQSGTENEPALPSMIRRNLSRIADNNPRFRSYTMTGYLHTILPRNEFYDDSKYATSLVNWVTMVIKGEPVESVWVGSE